MGGHWSSLESQPSPESVRPAPQPSSDNTCTTDQDVQQQGAAKINKAGEEECHGDKETNEESDNELETEEERRRGQVRQEELESFKEELQRKRALRHETLAALQAELQELRSRASQSDQLRQLLEEQQEENKKLVFEKEKLMEQMEHKAALERQIQALKDVSEIGKEMLKIRELQVKELKKKLVEINITSVTAPPEDLRIEYEKQIENIRKLRTLYEERAAATLLEHRRQLEREEARITVLETKLSELQKETEECKDAKKELEEKIEKLESTIQGKDDDLASTKDKLFSCTIQNKSLNSQIKLINTLFSQMIISPNVDLDRLIRLLKDNHGLITDLTETGDSNEVAALLVDLAGQVEKENEEKKSAPTPSSEEIEDNELQPIHQTNDSSQSEIASNLSKVWKVIIELLSHHQNSSQTEISGGADSCYKSIQTPSGPRSVISVSQTFITLKDLILEKNRLVKEVGRLKTLNSHLEHRLGSQEKRLIVVTSELRKTWGVVNKLKAQHKQLHTHEKILRYELQQKRCMLNELKQELVYCKDKWEQARQKNSQTEEDWKKLRKEFALRKSRKESNSAESGYEEEDVAQSPPSEPIMSRESLFVRQHEGSETELSEEDMEHSDGNSFDTVIDLLDIACIENPTNTNSDVPFALCEAPPETPELPPNLLLPLTGSEFTEGLDQIESEDLAAVLDVQYQTQLLGADYNLSLPSSSGSSPIPTENEEFALSEMDVSEEDSSSNDNHVYTTPLPFTNQSVSEDKLLFGSNSSKNISKFLEGLFTDQENNDDSTVPQNNLHLDVPSTSQRDENDSTTPIVNNMSCYQFPVVDFSAQSANGSPKESTQEENVSNDEISKQTFSTEQESIFQQLSTTENTTKSHHDDDNPSKSLSENRADSPEDSLRAREERLKKLEKQCRSLVTKVMSTSFKSEVLSNKLDELHQCCGSSEDIPKINEKTETCLNDTKTQTEHSDGMKTLDSSCCEASIATPNMILPNKHSEICHKPSMSETENAQATPLPQKEIREAETFEERTARVTRLEDQCKSLFSKMSASSSRSEHHLKNLDEHHGKHNSHQSKVSCGSRTKAPAYKRFDRTEDKKQKKSKEMPDLDSESKAILRNCSRADPPPETSTVPNSDTKKDRTPEQILEARAERFKRLEEQCKSLVSRMTATSLRSEIISNKLDELHSCYGSSDSPSGCDEHSTTSEEGKVRSPNSSPRHNRRMVTLPGRENLKEDQTELISSPIREEETRERVTFPQSSQQELDQSTKSPNSNIDRSKRTPEEILQARAQRLSRLEEQCKSLFGQMSATSQRSDVISNKLEELHEQYGQPSTSRSATHDNTISVTTEEATTENDSTEENQSSQQNTSGTVQEETNNPTDADSSTDNNEERTESLKKA
ncbi:centromere protein F-like [Macrosteles quadrilineatus]|uniref:centromere protein F-like n=1 Tax=Macrosteles quadrilineatus TaxID=74068 RepID=UPI0023E0A186|nr:centromere protein F-like [Macrosteles quadrilineatus]